MKRSKKVTLVLITAALASCNRYLTPIDPSSAYAEGPQRADSCAMQMLYDDPVYYPWYGGLMQQWGYAFNPFAYNYYYYGPRTGPRVITANRQGLFRPTRRGVVRGGWGRSAHTTVNS